MGFVFSIIGLLAVSFLVNLPSFLLDGSAGRDKMNNTSNIDMDAQVISCEAKKYGMWSTAHFELVVTFSDGSYYRTQLGRSRQVQHNKWRYSYNKRDADVAIRRAIAAHEKAALEKG